MFVIDTNKPASTGLRGQWTARAFAACLTALPVVGQAVTLDADRALSTDGAVQLSWALDGQPVQLQRADEPGFRDPRTVYQGSDSASLRTGLVDGDYWFRLRPQGAADWSEPVAVQVRHHGAVRTWGLFGLGALVFLSIVGMIVAGTARESRHG